MVYWNLESVILYIMLSVSKLQEQKCISIPKLQEQRVYTHDINGGGDGMYTADNICKMIEFLIDNTFVQFGGRLFRQMILFPL